MINAITINAITINAITINAITINAITIITTSIAATINHQHRRHRRHPYHQQHTDATRQTIMRMEILKNFRFLLLVAILSLSLFYLSFDLRSNLHHFLQLYNSDSDTKFVTRQRTPLKSFVTTQDSNSSYHSLDRGAYIRVGNLDVAIITAVHYPDYPAKGGYNVFLNGWVRHRSKMEFKCCFIRSLNATDAELVEATASAYHVYAQWVVDMQNGEFSCSISGKQLQELPPLLINTKSNAENKTNASNFTNVFNYITFAETTCQDSPLEVLKIEYRKTIADSVGICLKISYGSLNPELIVEWFEYQKLLGVTKVFTFLAEDLTDEARKVFQYYRVTGFLETNPIFPATKTNGTRRGFASPTRWHKQAWVDEVVAINDCKHRMAGLDFVIVQDIDEFIVPKSQNDNIYTILKRTLKKFPMAGAFSFNSHVAMLDWGETRHSPLHVMRYMNITNLVNYDGADRNTRWAFISDRIFFAQNNKAWPRQPFQAVPVLDSLYTLIHRRRCKKNWKNCSNQTRHQDDTLERYEYQMIRNMKALPLSLILGWNSIRYIQDITNWNRPVV